MTEEMANLGLYRILFFHMAIAYVTSRVFISFDFLDAPSVNSA